jgi:putative tricarboxylic transport membrane protein
MWARLALIPYRFMAPAILVVCFIGAYSVRNRMFDAWMAVFFGLLGYLFDKVEIPVFPLVMTLILGNMLESNLGQMLTISGGSFGILVARPIALGLLLGTGAIIAYSVYTAYRRRPRKWSEEFGAED